MRNVHCRRYDECLTEAAKKNAELDCSHCRLKNDRKGLFLSLMDWEACRLLLMAIFKPEQYRKYRQLREKIEEGINLNEDFIEPENELDEL